MPVSKIGDASPAFRCIIRFFVAGDAPNSIIARDNLRRLRESLPEIHFEIEIVDVNLNPEMALQKGVFVTPALEVLEPSPGGIFYGNLSNSDPVRRLIETAK
ncbi:MAG: circadian clock KaiB family protein [Desulfomonilaceae bacterium]